MGFEFTQHAVSGLNHVSFQTAPKASPSTWRSWPERGGRKARFKKLQLTPKLLYPHPRLCAGTGSEQPVPAALTRE